MKTKKTYRTFFNPQSIAIVGASNKKGKIGTIVAENILKLGYRGKTYLVNPAYKILKMKICYSSLSAIGKPVDTAIVCVPAKFVVDVVKDGAKNVKNFVIISSGFSEIGKNGAKLEKQLLEIAQKHKLNILGPNCLGFITPGPKINASFAGGMPEKGNIAFVSQSGALAVALMDKAKEEHLKFSNIISVGNKMQLDESELLTYLANDKETKVIGMYLEGIKNGAKFLETAKKVSFKKPIVVLKAGKTAKAQKAISSHTGALAGSDDIMNVAFESAGVIRANDLDEFFNLLEIISFTDAPRNNEVAAITNAGGAGVLTADSFKGKAMVLSEFDEKTKNMLKEKLPAESSVENPVDLMGDAMEDRYENILKLLNEKDCGSTICILTPQQQTPVEEIAKTIIRLRKTSGSEIVAVFIGGERTKNSVLSLKQNNIPNFSDPGKAVNALEKYYKWDVFRKKKNKIAEQKFLPQRAAQITKIIANAQRQNRRALLFSEAAEVMKQYGIDCVESYAITTEMKDVSEIKNYPVVLKVDSDKILHKSDRLALILNIEGKDALSAAIKKLQENFPGEQLLVQEQLSVQGGQTEIILGIKKDEIFGPIIVYGLGGIYTEVFKMVDFLIPPMNMDELKESISGGKIGFLFSGARGQAAYNLDEFAKIILGLMEFALENSQVKEFDINPIFIYNYNRKACAVDVKLIF